MAEGVGVRLADDTVAERAGVVVGVCVTDGGDADGDGGDADRDAVTCSEGDRDGESEAAVPDAVEKDALGVEVAVPDAVGGVWLCDAEMEAEELPEPVQVRVQEAVQDGVGVRVLDRVNVPVGVRDPVAVAEPDWEPVGEGPERVRVERLRV